MKLTIPLAGLAAGIVLASGAAAGVALAGDDAAERPTMRLATPAASDDVADDLSGPCDEAEHAGDPRCADAPAPTEGGAVPAPAPPAPSTPVDPVPQGELRSFAAASAGVVSYTADGSGFRLVAATPADGWSVEVEQAAGDEIDLDFRKGTVRIQVDVEREDGQVRERVRVRDDATDDRRESEVFVPSPGAPTPAAPVAPTPTVDDHGGDVDRDDRVEDGDDRSGSDDRDDRDDDDRDDDDRDDDSDDDDDRDDD